MTDINDLPFDLLGVILPSTDQHAKPVFSFVCKNFSNVAKRSVFCEPFSKLSSRNEGWRHYCVVGSLSTLRWMDSNRALDFKKNVTEKQSINLAAENGHLEVVKWLDANGYDERSIHLMDIVAQKGHLDVMMWLHENGVIWTKNTMALALRNGHLEVAKWLHANGVICTENTVASAVRNGNLEVVKWLHSRFVIGHNDKKNFNRELFELAADEGHLMVVEWLFENGYYWFDHHAYGGVMDRAAAHGNLEIVKWLHENLQEGCTWNAMDWAAMKGHLNVVKWLHEHRSEGCSRAMDYAANNGHLEVLKFLHEHRSEKFTCFFKGYTTHKEVAQWIKEHYNRVH